MRMIKKTIMLTPDARPLNPSIMFIAFETPASAKDVKSSENMKDDLRTSSK